jgi:hypothetical protein
MDDIRSEKSEVSQEQLEGLLRARIAEALEIVVISACDLEHLARAAAFLREPQVLSGWGSAERSMSVPGEQLVTELPGVGSYNAGQHHE